MSSQWHAVEHHSIEVDQVGLQGLWMGYQAEAEGNVMLPGPMTTFLNKMGQGGRPTGKRTGAVAVQLSTSQAQGNAKVQDVLTVRYIS